MTQTSDQPNLWGGVKVTASDFYQIISDEQIDATEQVIDRYAHLCVLLEDLEGHEQVIVLPLERYERILHEHAVMLNMLKQAQSSLTEEGYAILFELGLITLDERKELP